MIVYGLADYFVTRSSGSTPSTKLSNRRLVDRKWTYQRAKAGSGNRKNACFAGKPSSGLEPETPMKLTATKSVLLSSESSVRLRWRSSASAC
jgi:hypothetical protein